MNKTMSFEEKREEMRAFNRMMKIVRIAAQDDVEAGRDMTMRDEWKDEHGSFGVWIKVYRSAFLDVKYKKIDFKK